MKQQKKCNQQYLVHLEEYQILPPKQETFEEKGANIFFFVKKMTHPRLTADQVEAELEKHNFKGLFEKKNEILTPFQTDVVDSVHDEQSYSFSQSSGMRIFKGQKEKKIDADSKSAETTQKPVKLSLFARQRLKKQPMREKDEEKPIEE